MKIESKDLKKFNLDLEKLFNEDIISWAVETMDTVATDVQTKAINNAPVDTGYLKGSIHKDKTIVSGDSVESGVTSGADYSVYVEFGTGDRGAESYEQIEGRKEEDISYTMGWSGQRAQPFMMPAFYEAEEELDKAVKDFLRSIK